jgi:serine/threonine protein kinase
MLQRTIYNRCGRCEDVLQRSQWLLEPTDWELEKLGSGGNGQIYKATCRETKCEHAAKFLPYGSGRWECEMTERVQEIHSKHVVKAICSGLSRNPIDGTSGAAPKIVLLLELMSEDLFEAVFAPSSLSYRMFAKPCALRHIAYQLLQGIRGQCSRYTFRPCLSTDSTDTHEAHVVHDDIKMENIMVKYLPGCGIIKVGDLGNAVPINQARRYGGTIAYSAPENVIGLLNRGQLGDVFASGIVLIETLCRSTLMPDKLLTAYQNSEQGASEAESRRWVQLYHLVLLSSLIEQRPVYAGLVVRRYFGNLLKARVREVLASQGLELEDDLCALIVGISCAGNG